LKLKIIHTHLTSGINSPKIVGKENVSPVENVPQVAKNMP